MASGYYPLEVKYDKGGQALADVADTLKVLLDKRGEYGVLPASWDNDQHDNAADDGGYETYLYLALELIERCIKRATAPHQERANPSPPHGEPLPTRLSASTPTPTETNSNE